MAKNFWEFLRLSIKEKYSKQDWLESLGNDNNVILLLYYIHTQLILTKQEKFLDSDSTIEDFEASGLIYLEQHDIDLFISRAPLILIFILVDYFNLDYIFNKLAFWWFN